MFAGVGERTREGNDLYNEMIEAGVIKVKKDAKGHPAHGENGLPIIEVPVPVRSVSKGCMARCNETAP